MSTETDPAETPTDRTPTRPDKPGWYRAKWKSSDAAWSVVFVTEWLSGELRVLERHDDSYALHLVEVWGPNIDDALADLADLRRALTSACVTPDANGVQDLTRRLAVALAVIDVGTDEAGIRTDERRRLVKRLREAADEFIAAMPPGVSDDRVLLSSIASAFRDEADDIEALVCDMDCADSKHEDVAASDMPGGHWPDCAAHHTSSHEEQD